MTTPRRLESRTRRREWWRAALTVVFGLSVLEAPVALTDQMAGTRWEWPVPPPQVVVRGFDPPDQPWLPGHRGVDLGAAAGDSVSAVADGVVVHVGVINGVGTISVQHGERLRSTYQPVTAIVERGSSVRAGQTLGVLAETGSHCQSDACLHLGAIVDRDTYVDPMLYLSPHRVSLLPP